MYLHICLSIFDTMHYLSVCLSLSLFLLFLLSLSLSLVLNIESANVEVDAVLLLLSCGSCSHVKILESLLSGYLRYQTTVDVRWGCIGIRFPLSGCPSTHTAACTHVCCSMLACLSVCLTVCQSVVCCCLVAMSIVETNR